MMTRFHSLSLALVSLMALCTAGCKQDNGERCEQPSDCSSGICGYDTTGGMTSAMGKMCQATISAPGSTTPTDASAMSDAPSSDATNAADVGDGGSHADASDAATLTDASDAGTSDAPETRSTDASDGAAAETGGDASGSDGAVDAAAGAGG
jgi:hypothetical protein